MLHQITQPGPLLPKYLQSEGRCLGELELQPRHRNSSLAWCTSYHSNVSNTSPIFFLFLAQRQYLVNNQCSLNACTAAGCCDISWVTEHWKVWECGLPREAMGALCNTPGSHSCPVHLFIWLLTDVLHNKPVNTFPLVLYAILANYLNHGQGEGWEISL